MVQDSRKLYKKISDKKVKDTIKYLAVKHNLDEAHIKEIVLKHQFQYARGRMSSGYWRNIKLIDFGIFKFNKVTFDKHFQRVCQESEERYQELQDLLTKDENNPPQ